MRVESQEPVDMLRTDEVNVADLSLRSQRNRLNGLAICTGDSPRLLWCDLVSPVTQGNAWKFRTRQPHINHEGVLVGLVVTDALQHEAWIS